MSTIEEEIAAVQAATRAKLGKLRERERKERRALELRVVALLREHDEDRYEALSMEARAMLEEERAERRSRASRAVKVRTEALSSGRSTPAGAGAPTAVPDGVGCADG